MIDEKIILPDFLIADLYKECLVEATAFPKEIVIEPVQEVTAKAARQKIKYQGENRKNVIVIVQQAGENNIPKDDLDFLSAILKACQLSIKDIAIVNIANQPADYTALKEQLNSRCLLLFGTEPSSIRLPFLIPLFQVQQYDNISIVTAPALSELNQQTQEGRVLKTKLWASLKQVFGV